MRKIVSGLLCIALCMSLAILAYAEDTIPTDGAAAVTEGEGRQEGSQTDSGAQDGTQSGNEQPDQSEVHTHNFETVVSNTATCGENGVITFECSCGEQEKEISAATGNHTFGSAVVVKKPTCKDYGYMGYVCNVCGYEHKDEENPIAKLTTHTYDSACDKECNVCKTIRVVEDHTFTKVWSKGYDGHWYECTKCGEKKDFAKHTAGPAATEEKDQVCTVCNYVIAAKKEHKHTYETEWTSDKAGHWHACTGKNCHTEKDYASHNYDDECDPDCNICGFERENSHQYDTEGWMTSNFEHWNVCSICKEESVHEKHIPGSEATEKEAQICTVCGYEMAAKLEHTHDFGTRYIAAKDNHWQECKCGELSVPEPHTWDHGVKNKKDTIRFTCTACGEEKIEAVASGFSWLTVILVVLVLVCLGGIAALVIMLKRGAFDDEVHDEDEGSESIVQAEQEEYEDDYEEDYEDDSEEKMIDDYFASLDQELYK